VSFVSISKTENPMLERASKWIQRLDSFEYVPKPEAAEHEIPDVDGKRGFRFGELLSRAMTNFQAVSGLLDELTQMAAEGRLTANLPYQIRKGVSEKWIKTLEQIMPNREYTSLSDRVILDTVRERRTTVARDFLYYIDYGISTGTLIPGPASEHKLDECEAEKKRIAEERDRFQDQLEQVSTELISVRALYEDCQRKYEECERNRRIHPFGGTGTDTSGG
jgi:hypothetical protein